MKKKFEIKKKAVIVDIDNTLARKKQGPDARGIYEWDRVGEDEVIEPIAELVRDLYENYVVIIITGRDFSCCQEIQAWLDNVAKIHYNQLHMKNAGSFEKTLLTKSRHYMNNIKDHYDVQLVIDDDLEVLKWFKAIDGISVLQPI